MRVLVTGGAGFIASYLAERAIADGCEVLIVDDLSTGSRANIPRGAEFIRADLLEHPDLESLVGGCDEVYHFAADPDVRHANLSPREYLTSHVNAALRVASCMRPSGVLVFASSSTVYGEADVIPTPETYGPCVPISVYGAMKLACESIISGMAHIHGFRGLILRYANVVGARSAHGVVRDFVTKLKSDPETLEILGNGEQRKSYIHIGACVDATMDALIEFRKGGGRVAVYNVGSLDAISVREVAVTVSKVMGLEPEFRFVPADREGRGWKGDVRTMHLDISRILKVSGAPGISSESSVRECAVALLSE